MDRYVIATAGVDFTKQAGAITFTIGEPIAQSLSNDLKLTQGFQQEWAIVTALDDPSSEILSVHVYPNPTFGILNIETAVPAKIYLFDLSAKLILSDKIEPGLRTMQLTNTPAGMYVLVCISDEGKKQVFRLEKM